MCREEEVPVDRAMWWNLGSGGYRTRNLLVPMLDKVQDLVWTNASKPPLQLSNAAVEGTYICWQQSPPLSLPCGG